MACEGGGNPDECPRRQAKSVCKDEGEVSCQGLLGDPGR